LESSANTIYTGFFVKFNISFLANMKHFLSNGLLICLLFFIIDIVWIRALPLLNVSYGSSRATLFIATFLRGLIFSFWLLLLLVFHKTMGIKTGVWLLLIPNVLFLATLIYGFFIEPSRLTVDEIQVPVAGLEKPVRIVQLSDIHVERTTKRERELPALVESLKPDLIVITGDFLNESYSNVPQTINDLDDLMRQLNAPLGIYAINGNVESAAKLKKLMQGLPVQVLDNKVVYIPQISENFAIVGLSFSEIEKDEKELGILMRRLREDDFSLLLYHKPDLAYAAEEAGVDLYLAGHTHGGQVRLPFYGALYTNSRYGKTFEMGLYHLNQMILFVNRGLGFTGGSAPRIRILAPPEVVVIDLVPE
jgi:predicted MPP superfamily phosphohydrolase